MQTELPVSIRWSDHLAHALVRGMSGEDVLAILDAAERKSSLIGTASEDAPRNELISQSREDEPLQLAIMQRWRQANAALVAAVEHVPIDGCSAEQCEAMLDHFGVDNVLLELVTDEPHDDGMLINWVIDNVASENSRRRLATILQQWFDIGADEPDSIQFPGPTARIVIFGGHHRDENKMNERLFDNSRFDVRWKQCEKSRGTPDDKTLHEAMASADAAIVVTSMVSHNVMIIVRRFAKKQGIAFRTVIKATDSQLQAVLDELFPEEQVRMPPVMRTNAAN